MLSEDSLQTEDNKMEIVFAVGDKQGRGDIHFQADAGSLHKTGKQNERGAEIALLKKEKTQ